MVSIAILDGYIDEPTCLGVPPYISPYPRYIAGAIWTNDTDANIQYHTIDQIRSDHLRLKIIDNVDILIVIAGVSVPGRYLAGYPASPTELTRFLQDVNHPLKLLCGPAAHYGFGMGGGKKISHIDFLSKIFDASITGDPEIVIADLIKKGLIDEIDLSKKRTNAKQIRSYANNGAKIITQHPYHPKQLIAEIETYRGCPRSIVGGCSFCSEPSKGPPDFRDQKDIHDEIKALYDVGLKHIRIGNQPCIFSYKAHDATRKAVPRPNPSEIEKLFSDIHTIAPDLSTIHIDNANPGVIATYQDECEAIAETIITYHTSGDVAAMGVESVDPVVIKENNLKATADDVLIAIRLLNRIGGKKGKNGMPELLPGLNFLFGLKGETKKTFEENHRFLKQIYDEKLLVRRINMRQVIPIPGTRMESTSNRLVKKHHHDFQRFKRKIQQEIEQPLLERLVPTGTILTEVIAEKHVGNLTFGRQMGSYPLLIGIPGILEIGNALTVKVIDHGFRSITALQYPIDINKVPRHIIEAIPYIGKKRASHILLNRPYNTAEEFIGSFDDEIIAKKILEYITFEHQN